MTPPDASPLILTLRMDEASFARLDALRRAHFPPERNFIPAHVTLFHHLPGEEADTVRSTLHEAAAATEPLTAAVAGLRFLGRGVAFDLSSTALTALRSDLARRFAPWLTPQDRQGFRPHVTVQNKVAPDEARRLHDALRESFSPFTVQGLGLDLWRYHGGPWEAVETFAFRGVVPKARPLVRDASHPL